jgi:N-acyl-D-aspartate/D-glutamate deacylase
MHDLVIRGGLVVDGTGQKARVADVAVNGDAIVEVGRVGSGKREIDADGLVVTPGFVDIHTHYDAQATWDPDLSPSSWHGVTTAIMGSCGVGFAPASPDKHDWLISLMEGVEDIPGSAMTEGIQWQWESFPEYLDALEKMPRRIDLGAQIPHGALRAYIMGDRGAANEDATADDIERMYALVKEGLIAGAFGFSTSRTLLHKAMDGNPVPGTFAAREELFGIGRALRDTGLGVFQLATDHHRVPEEMEWMRMLALETNRPVMVNLSQIDSAPELWKVGLAKLEEAAKAGAPVYAQVAGRAIGVVMGFHLTAHPFALKPAFLEIMHESPEKKRRILQNPDFQKKLLEEQSLEVGEFEKMVTSSFHKMFPLENGVNYEPDATQSIAAMARRQGKRPEEIALELMLKDDTQAMLYFPLFNYSDNSLELLHELHSHPRTLMGLSDAGAHCGAICDGGMPTFMLTHWTRDRSRGPRLSLEHVVKRQTRDTAFAFGLHDRGVIAPGMKADLNVIDYENLGFAKPEVAYDLPAGGRRLIQRAQGYKATVLSGNVTLEDDGFTDVLAGRLLRGPQGQG